MIFNQNDNVEDRLNSQIELMLADRSLRAVDGVGTSSDELGMLKFAAALKSLKPEANRPEPGFVQSLRGRIAFEVGGV